VKKKGIVLLLAVVLLLVVAVLSLPLVLSSSTVLQMVLDRVNARSSSVLRITTCSIGWKQGLECRDIRFSDPAAGLAVTIPRLTGSQGLLALVAAPKNLGELTVHEPQVVLTEGKPGKQGQDKAGKTGVATSAPSAPAGQKTGPSAPGKPFWEDLQCRLLIRGGSVTSRLHLQPPRVIARALQFTSGLADGSIAYTLGLQDGTGKGRVAATGFINLPVRPEGLLEVLVSMVDLQITGFQIQDLLAFAAGRDASLPRGRGLLSGNVSLKTAGLANLTVKGDLELRDLRLHDGFLQSDRPAFSRVDLLLDAERREGRGWNLKSLALNSDGGAIKARGTFGPVERRVSLSGQLELPVLAGQLPGLMRMRKGVTLKSGVLDFSLDLEDRDEKVHLAAGSRLEQLAGTYEGRSFVWATPMTLDLQAEGSGREMRVGDLRFASSFVNINGRGDIKDFSLHATGDLERGFRELGLLFDLDWNGSGQLDLQASSKVLEEGRYAMDLSARVDGFTLLRAGRSVLPPHRLTLDIRGSGSPGALAGRDSVAVRCDLSTWPGRIHLEADNLSRKDRDLSSRYRLSSTVDLARLTDLLHNLELLPRQTTVTGDLALQADGFVEQGVVALRRLDAGVERFVYHGNGFSYRDARVRLHTLRPAAPAGVPVRVRKLVVIGSPEEFLWSGNGNSAVNLAGRGLYLRNLRLVSGLGRIRLASLDVADWQRLLETLTADIRAGISLQALAGLLHANRKMDPQIALAGDADLALRVGQDEGQRLDLSLQAPVTLEKDGSRILEEEQFSLTLKARRNRNAEDLVLERVAMASGPLSLDAAGLLSRGREPALALKGTVTPDLAALATLVEGMSGAPLVMSGRSSSPFDLLLPLDRSGEDLARQMRLSLDLAADTIRFRGIDLKKLTVPVRMEEGTLKASVHSVLNNGRLALDPVCRFTAEPPLLTIPDTSRVLAGVELQQPLVEGVLSRLHPLFGVLARPTGSLDMELATFAWPLTGNGAEQARFQALFDVSRVNLDSVGVLREVLALTGLDREKLRLKDTTITCTGARGRISCTPVRILVADSEMVISGSVGMDRTLDYLLQVPVTRNLVGREGYRVLEGTTIKVPIRGTLGQPLFNREMVTAAVADLARQAAGKTIRKEIKKALPGLLDGLIR